MACLQLRKGLEPVKLLTPLSYNRESSGPIRRVVRPVHDVSPMSVVKNVQPLQSAGGWKKETLNACHRNLRHWNIAVFFMQSDVEIYWTCLYQARPAHFKIEAVSCHMAIGMTKTHCNSAAGFSNANAGSTGSFHGASLNRLLQIESNETLHPGGRSSIGLARFCQPSPPGRLGCRRRDKTRGAGFLGQQRICCNGLVPNQLPKEAHLAYHCSEQRKWIQNCAARRLEDLEITSSGIQSKLRAFKASPTTKLW